MSSGCQACGHIVHMLDQKYDNDGDPHYVATCDHCGLKTNAWPETVRELKRLLSMSKKDVEEKRETIEGLENDIQDMKNEAM